jgi:hypothetical protein
MFSIMEQEVNEFPVLANRAKPLSHCLKTLTKITEVAIRTVLGAS